MRTSLLLLFPLVAACGGSTSSSQPASTPAMTLADPAPDAIATTAASNPAPEPVAPALPVTCANPLADVCTPPSAYVERLCAKPHQDVALALLTSGTPFTRMYLKGKLDELAWDEEVLVLRFHGVPKNGIQVGSAAGSYDVLRWNGSCSMAVDAGMLTRTKPPRPKTARVQWHRLGDRAQSALIAGSDAVKRAHAKRGKECQGAMSGDVSASCEKADVALVDAIVDYVRGGGSVPPPDGL